MIESDVSAIVLAAGTSSRMGRRNKLLALFQNKPLVLHVVDQLAASRVGEIVVVLGHEAEKIFDVLSVHKKTLRPLVPKSPRTCSPLPSFPRRRESKKCAASKDSRLRGNDMHVGRSPGERVDSSRITTQDSASHKNIRFVKNPDFKSGMTSSIQAGVRAARSEAEGFMICQADMPLITTAEYDFLLTNFSRLLQKDDLAIQRPIFKGRVGNPVIFSKKYKDAILMHPSPEGCRGILKENARHVHEIKMDSDHILQDIDTEEAFERITQNASG